MHVEATSQAGPQSIFNVRRNWNHLIDRPAFQEPVIDGVRALAILWVVAMHIVDYHSGLFPAQTRAISNNPFTSWTQNGTLGVDLFFVISGYLVGSILFRDMKESNGLRIARFYVRRFLRLIPAYFLAMLLAIYLLHGRNLQNAWANLLYVNNFLPGTRQYMNYSWSLAIEEQFYLVLPVFILLFLRLGKGRIRILAALAILSVVIRLGVIHASGIVPPFRYALRSPLGHRWFDVVYDKSWMRLGGLLAGVTGAYLSCYFAPTLKRFFTRTRLATAISIACLAFVGYVATTPVFVGNAPLGSVFLDRIPYPMRELWFASYLDIFSLAVIFLILATIHTPQLFGGWLRRLLSWKGFYPVAQLSYSLYLVHEMLFAWLFPRLAPLFKVRLGAHATIALDGAIALPVALLIAASFYIAVEQPGMRMRSHPAVLRLIGFFTRPVAEPVQGEEA